MLESFQFRAPILFNTEITVDSAIKRHTVTHTVTVDVTVDVTKDVISLRSRVKEKRKQLVIGSFFSHRLKQMAASKRKINLIRILATFVLLPAVVFLSVYSLDQQGFFKIDEVDLKISVKPSQKVFVKPYMESVHEKMNLFKGQSLWKFSLKNISEILRSESWIEDFRISRAWPSTLEIEIVPHEIAYLIHSKGKSTNASTTEFYPVTVTASVLKKVDSRQTPAVVVVHGDFFLKNKKLREGVVSILKSLPETGKLQTASISEVGYDKEDGYWVSLIQSDVKIKYGEDQFEIKSSRVSQVMDYLENRDLKARVIDANLSKKVLVRLH